MSSSLYKVTNSFGTDVIYNYFDLLSSSSIKTSYNESNTDNTKLQSNNVLNSNLKHVNTIGYQINNIDIASLYVPKCFVYSGVQTNINISVPILTTRIVFLLQAPGGDGHGGSNSPDNRGGDGGSGSLAWGYINRSLNLVNTITLNLTNTPAQGTSSVSSTLVFTGGTSITLTCWSGQPGQNTNFGGAGGEIPSYTNATGLTEIYKSAGSAGTNSDHVTTLAPYSNFPVNATFDDYGTTIYYPLYLGTYGAGAPGAYVGITNSNKASSGISAVWFLV